MLSAHHWLGLVIVAVDPLELSRALIRCPSITPVDAGALDVLAAALQASGFACERLRFEEPGTPGVDNLYARIGSGRPNLCFAGHTDIVPVGEASAWTVDPFAGDVRDGCLYGRGAADMKAAIACFAAAAGHFLDTDGHRLAGSISLLITGDEEGPAVNGTRKVLGWLRDQGQDLDDCLVGEPTNPRVLGEMIKIGRRGSLNVDLTVHGVQGHAAYPELADNPLPRLLRLLLALDETALDEGSDHFEPSRLTITSIDVGNQATNVIPARGRVRFNIRFNDRHTAESLRAWVEERCREAGAQVDLATECSGQAFVTPPGRLSAIVAAAATRATGRTPVLSTSGGTSDARFIKDVCPVVEFGMPGETAHKVDEHVLVDDVRDLTMIYHDVLRTYFADGFGA